MDLLKTLKKDALQRNARGRQEAPKREGQLGFVVSQNWKKVAAAAPRAPPRAARAPGAAAAVALDCEMVGTGPDGTDSILARVSITDEAGSVLLDAFVKPTAKVVDLRTNVTGIR